MSFEVKGRKGTGIPAGKYRVAIQQMSSDRRNATISELNVRFSEEKSPIIEDVTEGMGPLVIDVGKAMKGS